MRTSKVADELAERDMVDGEIAPGAACLHRSECRPPVCYPTGAALARSLLNMARLTPAERIEQSYDLAMMALADYLTHESDAVATIDRLIRILDRDSLRAAITEVLVDARVHPRPKSELPVRATEEAPQAPLDENDPDDVRSSTR